MKSKLYLILISFISLSALSCKTAKKLYEKGNYDEAVELATKKLQKDPDDQKFLDIIQNSYRYAVNDHESRIRTHSESNSELKWEWMYTDYSSLQKMYDAISKVPSVFSLIQPMDYSSYVATYAEKAGDVRFERGLSFMQRYDKKSYRNAYREFQVAAQLKPGNMAVLQKMEEAFEYAVTNVIILPMQQHGRFVYSSYAPGANNLDDEILRSLQVSTGDPFLKFYSSWDARARNIRTDMVVDMQLAGINIGSYHDHRQSRKVSKEVVIKETVIRPDSIVKEYAKVHATITTTHRTLASDALLRVNVRNADGQWLWNDHFSASHQWRTEFSSYTGDERALSSSDKDLVNRRPEFAPSDNEIVRCLIDELKNNAQYRIRNYFNGLSY